MAQVRRLLAGQAIAPGRLTALVSDVAGRFHLRRAPRLVVVDASISPLLWAATGAPTIVLPRQLGDSLDDERLRAIFAHELAHYTRRDHWTSLLAFLVTTLCWWNPIAWLARRELATAAEVCCDALAVERLAGSRKAYAAALLAVVDFVTARRPLRPALGIAFGESRSLRRRFEVLALARVRPRVSRAGWLLLAVACASSLLLPVRAEQPAAEPSSAQASAQADAPPDTRYYATGIVYDKQTHEPIPGAVVNLGIDAAVSPYKPIISAVTDAQGRYRIEVPLGAVKLWFPRLKPGYWLDPANAMATFSTSPAQPIATHDIAAHRGAAWPVRIVVPGGIPAGSELVGSVTEVENNVARRRWLAGESVSFEKSPNQSMSNFDDDGTGAITQCGDSGKLIVGIWGTGLEGLMTELVVEPGFDLEHVASATPLAGTDKTVLTDTDGRKATIGKAKVTLADGRPLLTFRLGRTTPDEKQAIAGRIVDSQDKPLAGVRVGVVLGIRGGGGGDTGVFDMTDDDGRFQLSVGVPKSKQKRTFSLVITGDGYAGFDSPTVDLPTKLSEVIDVGEFTLGPGSMLPLRVVDENDQPLAGAVVEPRGTYAQRRQATRTDAQGRAMLKNLPTGVINVYAHYGSLSRRRSSSSTAGCSSRRSSCKKPLGYRQPKRIRCPRRRRSVLPRPSFRSSAGPMASERKLSDYRGKVVVLDFWGVWCSACLNGLPARQQVEARYAGRDDVVFLGIHSAGTSMEQIKKLQQLKDWTLPTGLDQGPDTAAGLTARAYGARGWPTTVIIDRAGHIAYNSNLDKWDAVTAFQEQARIAKASNSRPPSSTPPSKTRLPAATPSPPTASAS